ncbi:hypothetical protein ONZ45_g11953 [Pleurotus djamor]|nr:hypothetical protein ONZ45_g11953 [Pleurotus djamor]
MSAGTSIPSHYLAISTNVEAQRLIDEEIENHVVAIRRLLKRRNTYSAVNQLPDEILAEFFRLATVDDKSIKDTLLNIASVCAWWRQICLATPQLWSTICFDHPRWSAELLSRAQGCPLSVYFSRDCHTSNEDCERTASILVPETRRFVKVEIYVDHDNPNVVISSFLRPSFAQPAPLLQHACIEMGPMNVFHGELWVELLSLRSLHLSNFIPTISLMPNLTLLWIETWEHENDLSVPWVIDLLRHTPRIETVNVWVISSDPPISVTGVIPVYLPNLSFLNLKVKGLRELKLLSFLEIPAVKFVRLIIMPLDDELSPEVDFAPLQGFLARYISHDIASLDVRVDVENQKREVSILRLRVKDIANEDTEILHLNLGIPSSTLDRVNLVQSLPLARIHKLEIHVPTKVEETLAWSNFLLLCPHLRELRVGTVATLLSITAVDSASSGPQSGTFIHAELERIIISMDHRSSLDDWARLILIFQYHYNCGKRLKLRILHSNIPISYVEHLKRYTELGWN